MMLAALRSAAFWALLLGVLAAALDAPLMYGDSAQIFKGAPSIIMRETISGTILDAGIVAIVVFVAVALIRLTVARRRG